MNIFNYTIYFFFTRLFVPHNENDGEALRSKLSEVYDHIPRYIRFGIKQLPGLPTKEGWHWGSGECISLIFSRAVLNSIAL